MVQVLIALNDSRLAAAVRARLDREMSIVYCPTEPELLTALASCHPSAVVVELRDERGRSRIDVVRRLARDLAGVPLLAYHDLSRSASRDILDAARAGISSLALRGIDDLAASICAVLREAEARKLVERALLTHFHSVPQTAADIVAACVECASEAPSVSAAARVLGVSRRSLARRAALSGLPAPRHLIAWARLLLAEAYLRQAERSVKSVAAALHFGSARELRVLFRRYTGTTPRHVRKRGVTASIVEAALSDWLTNTAA